LACSLRLCVCFICFKSHAHNAAHPQTHSAPCAYWQLAAGSSTAGERPPSPAAPGAVVVPPSFDTHPVSPPPPPLPRLFHVSHAARPVAWPALCRCLDPLVFPSSRCRSWTRKKGGGMGGGRHCRLMLSPNRPHLTESPDSAASANLHASMNVCARVYVCARVHVCACACARACLRVCACVLACNSLPSSRPPASFHTTHSRLLSHDPLTHSRGNARVREFA
jgi:hypothetical protein